LTDLCVSTLDIHTASVLIDFAVSIMSNHQQMH